MSWQEQLNGDPETWLLEPGSPGVRFLALRDLAGRSPDDPELIEACVAAHTHGPIETILSRMQPEGYWVEPGPGYYPKYRSGVWALLITTGVAVAFLHSPALGLMLILSSQFFPKGKRLPRSISEE